MQFNLSALLGLIIVCAFLFGMIKVMASMQDEGNESQPGSKILNACVGSMSVGDWQCLVLEVHLENCVNALGLSDVYDELGVKAINVVSQDRLAAGPFAFASRGRDLVARQV